MSFQHSDIDDLPFGVVIDLANDDVTRFTARHEPFEWLLKTLHDTDPQLESVHMIGRDHRRLQLYTETEEQSENVRQTLQRLGLDFLGFTHERTKLGGSIQGKYLLMVEYDPNDTPGRTRAEIRSDAKRHLTARFNVEIGECRFYNPRRLVFEVLSLKTAKKISEETGNFNKPVNLGGKARMIKPWTLNCERRQCYYCAGLEHTAEDCPDRLHGRPPTCSRCAGQHQRSECQSNGMLCPNCRKKNPSGAVGHDATNLEECPLQEAKKEDTRRQRCRNEVDLGVSPPWFRLIKRLIEDGDKNEGGQKAARNTRKRPRKQQKASETANVPLSHAGAAHSNPPLSQTMNLPFQNPMQLSDPQLLPSYWNSNRDGAVGTLMEHQLSPLVESHGVGAGADLGMRQISYGDAVPSTNMNRDTSSEASIARQEVVPSPTRPAAGSLLLGLWDRVEADLESGTGADLGMGQTLHGDAAVSANMNRETLSEAPMTRPEGVLSPTRPVGGSSFHEVRDEVEANLVSDAGPATSRRRGLGEVDWTAENDQPSKRPRKDLSTAKRFIYQGIGIRPPPRQQQQDAQVHRD